MTDDNLQVVMETQDEVESFLYRSMLQEAGIDVFEHPLENPVLPYIWSSMAKPRFELLVRREDVTKASDLIADFHSRADAGELQLDDAADVNPVEKQPRRSSLSCLVILSCILTVLLLLAALFFCQQKLLGPYLPDPPDYEIRM